MTFKQQAEKRNERIGRYILFTWFASGLILLINAILQIQNFNL
jgi:hypothetical protein